MPNVGRIESQRMSASVSYGWVFAGTLFQILIQFLIQRSFAEYFGAQASLDTYRAALTFPVAMSAMFVGTMVPVLIPKASSDYAPVRSLVSVVVIVSGLITVLIAGIASVFAEQLASHWLQGFSPDQLRSVVSNFRVLVWLLPVNTLIGLFQGVLNARQNFVTPAIAGVIGPLVTLLIIIQFSASYGIIACAWGTLIGALANVVLQLPYMRSMLGTVEQQAWSEFKRLVALSIPVFGSMLMIKLDPFVERYVISFLPTGSISYLDYSMQLTTIFIALSSGTLSTVAFPRIAKTAQDDRSALPREVAQAYQTLLLLTIPAMTVTYFFGQALIRDLLQTGEFSASDTENVAAILTIYSLVILGAGVGEISVKCLYALSDTWTPLWLGSSILLAGMILKIVLVPESGLLTYAWIVGLIYFPCSLFQAFIVYRRLGSEILQGLGRAMIVAVSGSAVAATIGWSIMSLEFRFSAVVGLIAGGIGYLGVVMFVGETPIRRLANQLLNRTPNPDQD